MTKRKKADTSLPELRRTCGDWFPEEQDAALAMIDVVGKELLAALEARDRARAEVERLRGTKTRVREAQLMHSLAGARALLDRCTMVPHSLLDDIRKWQSADPDAYRRKREPT